MLAAQLQPPRTGRWRVGREPGCQHRRRLPTLMRLAMLLQGRRVHAGGLQGKLA
jgi:hypothetical protein